MRITLDIDDDLYAVLQRRAARGRETPDDSVVRQHIKNVLTEFGHLGGRRGRYFVVEGRQRQDLEKIVQTTIETADQLVRHVRNLSIVKVGFIERPLNDSEVLQLTSQASFWGVKPEEHIKNTVDEAIRQALGAI